MNPMSTNSLLELTAYRHLLETPVLRAWVNEGEAAGLAALFQADFDCYGDWLQDVLRYISSPIGRALGRGEEPAQLLEAARSDLALLSRVFQVTLDDALLFDFYRKNGCGVLARYRAFTWDGTQLHGIDHPDTASEEELLGYDWQRGEVTRNTRALLEGRPHANVLLYGDSGTGKSATVKHQLTIDGFERLRLIEADKLQLAQLPTLMRHLRKEPFSFVIFIDDLAFDYDDITYSALKTILEGGIEPRPSNVAIYATSNRRNLVRQTISERSGDDMDRMETIAEKTALTERFSLRIAYMTLSKQEYLEMVEHLADFAGIVMERDLLRREAIAFEARHPGRTPRTAKQFVQKLAASPHL